MITRCRPLLGTFVEITVPDADVAAIDAAFAAIGHVHAHMSFHEPHSDLARLRAADPGALVAVDPDTATVLGLAVALHDATGGLFDVAVGRVLVRSGFLPRVGIAHLGCFDGDTGDIELIDDRHVRCRRRLLIDLGGIAKGYAVDRAVETLVAAGVGEGIVNAGGDLRLFGERCWPVHIRDGDGRIRRSLELTNAAIASSSNALDRKRHRGKTYSPHVGRDRQPVLLDRTVSVVAPCCVIADAMTKVAMVDPVRANALLAPCQGYVLPDVVAMQAA